MGNKIKLIFVFFLILMIPLLLFSVLGFFFPESKCDLIPAVELVEASIPSFPAVRVPEEYLYPPSVIEGNGSIAPEVLKSFLNKYNSLLSPLLAEEVIEAYMTEGAIEEINYEIAVAQMILETGYLKYGGDVKPEQYNFAGLGATGGGNPGLSFPSIREGVRAHIQHLKAYASVKELNQPCIDERFKYVKRGSAPTLFDLTGKWAADREYGRKIYNILTRIYRHSFEPFLK